MASSNPKQISKVPAAEAVPTPCLCAALRRASRVMTRRYDRHLKPSGLRVTQYSMLATIMRHPGVAVSELSRIMVMDQTTVTRNLQNLLKAGYIRTEFQDGDQRTKRIHVSGRGSAKLDAARPLWDEAQAEMKQVLGPLGMDFLLRSLHTVIN